MECSICHEELNKCIIFTTCQCCHGYHKKCIEKWLKISRSCPTCRKTFIANPFEIDKTYLDKLNNALFYDSIGRYSQFRFNNFNE